MLKNQESSSKSYPPDTQEQKDLCIIFQLFITKLTSVFAFPSPSPTPSKNQEVPIQKPPTPPIPSSRKFRLELTKSPQLLGFQNPGTYVVHSRKRQSISISRRERDCLKLLRHDIKPSPPAPPPQKKVLKKLRKSAC